MPSANTHLLEKGLPLPAYDSCLKASHLFNLLDARGVISVTERQAYIGQYALAKACCEALGRCQSEHLETAVAELLFNSLRRSPGAHAGGS